MAEEDFHGFLSAVDGMSDAANAGDAPNFINVRGNIIKGNR